MQEFLSESDEVSERAGDYAGVLIRCCVFSFITVTFLQKAALLATSYHHNGGKRLVRVCHVPLLYPPAVDTGDCCNEEQLWCRSFQFLEFRFLQTSNQTLLSSGLLPFVPCPLGRPNIRSTDGGLLLAACVNVASCSTAGFCVASGSLSSFAFACYSCFMVQPLEAKAIGVINVNILSRNDLVVIAKQQLGVILPPAIAFPLKLLVVCRAAVSKSFSSFTGKLRMHWFRQVENPFQSWPEMVLSSSCPVK